MKILGKQMTGGIASSIVARNLKIFQDDSKFGQKLMEKMGWSKGKGLGKDLQGEPEGISIRKRTNARGLGYQGRHDDWVQHYEGFESVLAALNSENNSAVNSPNGSAPNSNMNSEDEDNAKRDSLEARSKNSQARVHYHKFTRGKDLSRYNSDAIACVTGSKLSKRMTKAKKDSDMAPDVKPDFDGVKTIDGGNLKDYFAQKMALLKAKRGQQFDTIGTNAAEPYSSTSDCSFQGFQNQREDAFETMEKVEAVDDDSQHLSTEIMNDESSLHQKTHKKKKKHKTDKMDSVDSEALKDCIEESAEKPKKRKKVPKDSMETSECLVPEHGNKGEVSNKEKKNASREEKDTPYETQKENECTEEPRKKKKKKKHHKEV